MKDELQIHQITKEFEEARELILKGLEERFGFIDLACNPDLKRILESYNRKGSVLLLVEA